jgi:hypothetical protein
MTEQIWEFDVGTTTERPVVPDQYVSRVTVLANSHVEGMEIAALMCGGRKGVEMVTSTEWCP